jgi:hypothetical protein
VATLLTLLVIPCLYRAFSWLALGSEKPAAPQKRPSGEPAEEGAS